MYYTLAQAEEKLARFADGGACDVRSCINDALEQLSNLEAWRCLRRLVRISVQHDVLPLPQSVEALVRVCVDGAPSHVFGTDYQFLQSGVGDMDFDNRVGIGFSDYGAGHATMFDIDPAHPCALAAISSDPADTGRVVTVHGRATDGTDATFAVPVRKWAGSAGVLDFDISAVAGASATQVDRVVLPSGLRGYVSLYGAGTGGVQFLAKYHPSVIVPEFRRYRVNWTVDEDGPTSVLAEVKLRFMPLVAPTDVLPFDSLAAVQFMMQAVKEINAGNLQAGMNYQALAVSRLEEKESSQTRVQGLQVENALYDFSPGGATGLRLHNL